MGCCISSNNTKEPTDHTRFPSHKTHLNNTPPPPPPPPCLEEETVKEVVLSEPKPQPSSQNETEAEAHTLHHIHIPAIREHNTEAKDLILINKKEDETETSQASEIYTITDSFSTATTATTTTTITEKREDEAISKLTRHISPAKKVPRKRPYTGEISRGVKYPGKRAEVSRSAQGRTMPRSARSTGEGGSSVGRSRSPATRTVAGVGRSSAEKVPARTGGRGVGNGRLREEKEIKKETHDGVLKKKNNNMLESSESLGLDNGHVSLECFIFV